MRRDIIKMVLQDVTGLWSFHRSIRFIIRTVRDVERGYRQAKCLYEVHEFTQMMKG